MTMGGGNTDDLYKQNQKMDGRLLMAQSLRKQHPDVVRIIKRWGRWQHLVDYSKFRANKLIRDENVKITKGINNYDMKLVN